MGFLLRGWRSGLVEGGKRGRRGGQREQGADGVEPRPAGEEGAAFRAGRVRGGGFQCPVGGEDDDKGERQDRADQQGNDAEPDNDEAPLGPEAESGRTDRKSVGEGKRVAVGVEPGGRRSMNKTK